MERALQCVLVIVNMRSVYLRRDLDYNYRGNAAVRKSGKKFVCQQAINSLG